MLAATRDSKECQPSTSSSIEWSQPCRHFEFPEILLATYNFDESLVIGHGGFGKVYKGNIINGSSVAIAAIKRLDSMSSQGATEFWAEVEMLSKLRHCHLVSLLGYCNHEKEMILVYEYMPNGTLEDHLHKLGTPLSWLQRLKICIGTARGLDYLHTGTGIEFGVIHRDVKTSNILLHEGWAAKISDFGLSKIGATNQPTTYVNTLVKGTFGYLDPNYFSTGKLTRKSDVYAYGVVLLEMLCRKRAVDRSLDEEQWGLVTWVQESITKGNLKNIIDSGIRGEISPKCLKEFVQIAERCVHNNPKQRPTMAEVAVTLDSILTLQQKINSSLQSAGKTIFGRMLDKFSFTSNGEKSAHDDTKPSITTEDNSKTAGDTLEGDNKKLEDNSKTAGDAVGGDNKKLTSLIINPSLKIFKFADLESTTRNFSQDLLIDRDGYGEVFIGWVDDKTFAPSTKGVGIAVAVKRYNEGLPESETLAARLGWLAHPNVTSLLGYCDDHKHSCLLVYEHMHMENRNFSHFLFGADVGEPLSWGTRLLILLGVARGLAYVHSSKENVIHGGIKTFNILLDQNFNAKMGHFGLAVQPKTRELNATTRDMDTMRYFDQWDLKFSGVFTTKSDVYSFGVVLLETITGQRVWEPKSLPSLFNLKNWSRPFLADKSKLKDIIDPRLEQNYPLEGAFECLALATRCLASDAKGRPSSKEILLTLEQIYSDNK